MANRSRKFRGIGVVSMLALVLFIGAAAVAFYVTSGVGKVKPPREKPPSPKRAVVTFVSEKRNVTIYVPSQQGERVYLAPVTVKTEVRGTVLDSAVNALIAASRNGGQASGLIPEGTRLLAPVKVDHGVATVNLSKQFLENFSGGSDQEALTLNSIVHTLVDNSGGQVRKARILVEGETAETLGGHFELTEPIEADSTLLAPGSGN